MRSRPLLTALLAVGAAAIATGLILSTGSSSDTARSGPSIAVLQMNLCLSGQAGCYDQSTRLPLLDEVATQIEDQDPAAVTISEACRRDVAELARRTGYELTFAAVDYGGAPLPCIDPDGRGLFGIAVLTRDPVTTTHRGALPVEADPEERRWLCATTSGDVAVCTAHLSTRLTSGERADNDAQCRELRSVLAGYEGSGTTVFGGDLNRTSPCAPSTMWLARDTAATQSPGVQHVYGSGSLGRPSVSVVEASYTDHDFLLAAASAR